MTPTYTIGEWVAYCKTGNYQEEYQDFSRTGRICDTKTITSMDGDATVLWYIKPDNKKENKVWRKVKDLKQITECEVCEGDGYGYWSCCNQELVDEDIAMCPICHEHLGEEECIECEGKGYEPKIIAV